VAEDSDLERTEPASARRLEQAREEGQVARSQELNTFAVLLAGGLGIWLLGHDTLGRLAAMTESGLVMPRAMAFDAQLMMTRLADQGWQAMSAVLPLLGLIFLAAFGAPLLLNGWLFTLKGLQPDFSRMNPLSGIARIFSIHGLVGLAKAVAKTVIVGGVAVWVIWHYRDGALRLISESPEAGIGHLGAMVTLAFVAIALAMAPIVAIDAPFQLWEHHRKLRMSKDEVRKEMRESEGDPHVKARIRSLQREAAKKRMMAEVPKADVVVVNPTRFAVALRYQEGAAGAPRVVAKGMQLVAARIREIATEHAVPIVEAPPLARALHQHAELGDEIPEVLYAAVAEVLAYIYQLRRHRAFGGKTPEVPRDLPVPVGLDPEGVMA
jgi:flagellar biosynthesis protein FlhB